MNITIENLGACKRLIRVDVPVEKVHETTDEIVKLFQRQAQLPGFRAGKAPKHMVLKTFGSRVEKEVRSRLVQEGYRQAVKENDLHVVGNPDVEEIQFGKDLPFQFAVTLETAPEIELPNYKGLKIKKELRAVTEEDIDKAIDVLRDRQSTFEDRDRELQENDYVVVDYQGFYEDKPIVETEPEATSLNERKDYWLHAHEGHFLPGFATQLIGVKAGDSRTIEVEAPAEANLKSLAGKKLRFEVTVKSIKEKVMPELDDEFAQSYGANDVSALRDGVSDDLEKELKSKTARQTREQLAQRLMEQVHCELPESVVERETRQVIFNLVRENQRRGVPKETIDDKRDEIYQASSRSAKDRVKLAFIIGKIAAAESITAKPEEVSDRINQMAETYNMAPATLLKKLKERDGIAEIQEQILTAKVMDLMELHAEVEEVLPTSD